jgi:hypothetical protein
VNTVMKASGATKQRDFVSSCKIIGLSRTAVLLDC